MQTKETDSFSGYLIWDKDDEASMDFVTPCAMLRAHILGIGQKSRFDVKAMAGSIIPAIASANAIIAELIVFKAFKVLEGKWKECSHVIVLIIFFLNKNSDIPIFSRWFYLTNLN